MALGSSDKSGSSNDMALIGDTRMDLQYKPLPKKGPVIGPMSPSKPESDSRIQGGSGFGG